MSENKKYFYLKLKDSFFSSEEMMMLENIPEGLVYQNIYLRLCLLSLKTEGALTFKNMIPYDARMLSTVLHIDLAKMEFAINTFVQLGLMVKTDSKTLFMSDIQSLIGKSSTEAERIANYRRKLQGCTKSVQMLQNCTPEIEIEIEIEKEIEKEKEIEIEKEIEKETNSCSEQTSSSEPEETHDRTISLILNDNTEWCPSKTEISEFSKLYPNVDVIAELRKMRGWCIGNPKKRKTRQGIKRFVTGWLGKEQDKPSFTKKDDRLQGNCRFRTDYSDEEYRAMSDDPSTIAF